MQNDAMSEDMRDEWRTPEEREGDLAQAKALREQASKGGLRFETYLPPELAKWVLDLVERGIFTDPGEAVFVFLRERKDLEPHADLRQEILSRSIEAALNDPRPPIPGEKVREWLEKLASEPQPEAAIWRQRKPA